MIKELFLAIILGALLGFGVTGGFFAFQKNKISSAIINITPTIAASDSADQTSQPQPTISTTNSASKGNLTVDSPQNNSIVSNSKISITGSTIANSIVIVTTLSKTYNTMADNNGDFTVNVELDTGLNQIKITSIDDKDNQSESQISITYSTAKI